MILFTLFYFFLGTIIGSFLNVLIDRLPSGRNILSDRSECENCKHKLSSFDLIPIFSFIALKGKCRYCKAKIPNRLFFIEILTGFIFASTFLYSFYNQHPLSYTFFLLIILSCFIAIFFADLIYGIIPNELVMTISASSLLYHLVINQTKLPNHLISAAASFLFFFIIFVATKGKGMGFGDVKLSLALGLLLGFPLIVVSHYISFLTGAAVSIILILWRKKKIRGSTIPFGPFMIIGGIVSILFGNEILKIILPNLGLNLTY